MYMKRIQAYMSLILLLWIMGFSMLIAPAVNAQTKKFPLPGSASPTPSSVPIVTPGTSSSTPGTPGSGPERIANCDVCGYCDGGKTPGRWESCRSCMYPAAGASAPTEKKTLIGVPTPDPYHYYTDLGCISTKPGEFASQITSFFFSIVGGIAFLTFLYGTAVLATARADAQQINHGRRIILGSIIGLLFALFSIFIVKFLATGLGLPL
jgi:hypothetical protein